MAAGRDLYRRGAGQGTARTHTQERVHIMKSYDRKVNGYKVRQQLSDEDAKRLGLVAAEPEKAPKRAAEKPVETAKVEPENKQPRGGGRGRKLNRD